MYIQMISGAWFFDDSGKEEDAKANTCLSTRGHQHVVVATMEFIQHQLSAVDTTLSIQGSIRKTTCMISYEAIDESDLTFVYYICIDWWSNNMSNTIWRVVTLSSSVSN